MEAIDMATPKPMAFQIRLEKIIEELLEWIN
jgi:hypothetical protein